MPHAFTVPLEASTGRPGLSQGYPRAQGSGVPLQNWGFWFESLQPQLEGSGCQGLDPNSLGTPPHPAWMPSVQVPKASLSVTEPGGWTGPLRQPGLRVRAVTVQAWVGGLPLGRTPPQQCHARVASVCSHFLLLPTAPLSGSSRLMAVLQDGTREPTVSERLRLGDQRPGLSFWPC